MMSIPNYYLLDGYKLPQVGFGTYGLNGTAGVRVIEAALNTGYRLIDSAFNYENEGTVGQAIRNSSVPRSEITVTSKLPGRHHQYAQALDTIQESVLRTGLDYLDLYLIHWPNPKEDLYVEAWQALIDARRWGWIRSIGVCNFLPEHINRIEKETGVLPVVNQIELHPKFNQATQRAFDQSKKVITEAWSPLGRASDILKNELIGGIAQKYRKSIPQIILRWQIQLGALPIPKASHVARQEQNITIFDFNLTAEEMALINQLNQVDGRLQNQDPSVYQEF
ncbi:MULTISPECIES: aldo/keto reductase [unclassified Enterococcus]|uniref:aldo/keto reductase n=1 Tax=unclassified Enterococcus TaxID=2608891 RepID=UPI001BCA8FC9|nr:MULTISPECIES: aldo/keto reductase [unclassified Enterococcus]MBS7577939.1 aldo/keto reductase [Enterococcus sp. MMGLQ5-2]MBS7585200.1 aldo/keto reductase [Enterococcus sp. MMGLQ5-1]NPD13057.1 aldo/keto reductase [Enterococcus sp. MMGLQ5-1]NPD37769.1 aldo/keto reductase [Enterococcus sp. MMGLQ5-2]